MEFQYLGGDEKRPVRTIDQDGEPWFVARDVCGILGYANPRDALKLHVDEEDRHAVGISDTIGRDPITNVINESGLYSLIMGSKKPAARLAHEGRLVPESPHPAGHGTEERAPSVAFGDSSLREGA